MVDVFDMTDVLERVLTKGVVIEIDERPDEHSAIVQRAAPRPSIPVMDLKVLKVTDD